MTNAMEALYYKWAENRKDTSIMSEALDLLCNGKANTEDKKRNDVLFAALCEESMEAFSAGFKTAVQLLMGGGQA
ncbi:MAG: hypothetical protein NC205_00305 [Prevotella sp.]|nr:hypothetical protein [Alistipes senegalensis]MCM1357003.1 hypothetical protein [Prevotella sp.]MCM1472626.1 hypothetical protein [Muribaculaceae bacterium]